MTESALRCAAGADRLTVLYSGGLDSSLGAWLLRPLARVHLLCVATESGSDAPAARTGAELLGLPLTVVPIGDAELVRAFDRWKDELRTQPRHMWGVTLGTALALEASEARRVVCGQGADELFFGYAHARGLPADDVRRSGDRDLYRLVRTEWPRAQRIADALGRDLRSPFLDPSVIALARSRPAPYLAEGELTKPGLRSFARQIGLPSELADRPKKAFQYGSGINRALRALAPAKSVDEPRAISPG